MQVDNLFLEKCLGQGSFGEVFLTRKTGDDKIYATKKYERDKIENTEAFQYLKNEILILQTLNHPNIVKFEDIKKTKKSYYIVMEFCNGGELVKALEKYKLKYGKPFPEDLVQYLMRQIIDAFQYIHNQGIMHRDIKLENILLNYDNEQDKKDLNLFKAKVKIIDFGFAIKISKNGLTYTAIGNPINMDPLILKKLNSNGKKARQLGYDQKADIWSLGAICYEMLIGKAAFDAEDMEDLVRKVEEGKYAVPTSLSKEVVSFINGMLQYDSKARLDINKLANHPFLTKNVKSFHRIDLRQVSNKLNRNKELVIDVKKNKSIWSIFNDEDKLININDNSNQSPNQNNDNDEIPKGQRKFSQDKKNKVMPEEEMPIRQSNTFKPRENYFPNNIPGFGNNNNYNNNNYNNNYYGPILPPPMQGIPGNQMFMINAFPQNPVPQGGQIFSQIPMSQESTYSFSGGIYK